jgi:IS30 family transposase
MGAKYDQLDLDERIEMSRLHEAGTSRREIGRIIGRSASTVGRELRRNTLPRGGYKPASADRIALSRRPTVVPHRAPEPAAVLRL